MLKSHNLLFIKRCGTKVAQKMDKGRHKMTNEISKQEWKQFFNDASRNYLAWQTKVEILKADIGAQILSEGLPLIGLMLEEKASGEQSAIEIMVGEGSGIHQTHTVFNPQKVFFEEGEAGQSGTIEIEDESGAKTIVYIMQSISVLVAYEEVQLVAQA
jgi:hypothetical protein